MKGTSVFSNIIFLIQHVARDSILINIRQMPLTDQSIVYLRFAGSTTFKSLVISSGGWKGVGVRSENVS